MTECRVIAGPKRSTDSPIAGAPGDAVSLHRREDDEPGWRWCEHPITGLSGWVPEALLDIDGMHAVFNRGYSAMERTVSAGETLAVAEEIAGWSLCSATDGRTGWVPRGKLTPI